MKTRNLVAVMGGLAAMTLFVTGCATTASTSTTKTVKPKPTVPTKTTGLTAADLEKNAQKTLEQIQGMEVADLYNKYLDLSTKELVDFDTMIKRLESSQVIYIGEAHTNLAHHALQLRILDAFHKKYPKTAFAMEFLYRSSQPILDDYTAGRMSDREFDGKVAFGFGGFMGSYINLLRYAKDNQVKLIGLNVERKIKKKMAEGGWENLSAEEKKLVFTDPKVNKKLNEMGWEELTAEEQKLIAREVDLTNPDHRAYVMAQLKQLAGQAGHSSDPDQMNYMYYTQAMWDDTMGESIANYLKGVNDKNAKVVAIAGKSHIEWKFNIPDRCYKRYPAPFKTLVPIQLKDKRQIDFGRLINAKIGDFIYFSDFR